MEKEIKIAIIGALAVIGAALIEPINDRFEEGGDESDKAGSKEADENVSDEAESAGESPVLNSLQPDKTSSQETGTAIIWTASAFDHDNGRLLYKFSVKNGSADEPWRVGQNWSTQCRWKWTPLEAGIYDVQVEVRDPEENNDSLIERYEIKEKAISDEAEISEEPTALESLEPDKTSPQEGAVSEESERSREPPDLKSLKSDKLSPQETGTDISWTAEAEGRDDETLRYRFLLMGPSTEGSWVVVQDLSTQSTWNWTPTEAGSYDVQVEARYEDERDPDGKYPSLTVEDYHILVAISEEDPAVAVSSWGEGRLDLFVRGKDGALWHRYSRNGGSTWLSWEQLDGKDGKLLNSAPAAVSRERETIDVFARGEDNDLIHKRLEGSTWSDWESLGSPTNTAVNSSPAASSWDENRLDVFVRGTDDILWHKWWDGSNWSGWESLSGKLTSAPAAVSWGPNTIHVFVVRETGGPIKYKRGDGLTFGNWHSLKGVSTSAPAASSKGEDKLHVFARGGDNMLWCRHHDSSGWQDWIHVPSGSGKLTSAPAAVSWGSNRIDVFYKGTDNDLMHEKYDGRWRAPESIGNWPE